VGAGHHHHHHGVDQEAPQRTRRKGGDPVALTVVPTAVLLVGLVLAGLATVIGAFVWWPDHAAAGKLHGTLSYAVSGTTYVDGTITEVQPRCASLSEDLPTCGHVLARATEGPEKGQVQTLGVAPAVADAGLEPGDTIIMLRVPPDGAGDTPTYSWYDVDRSTPLWILAVLFMVVVAAVARLRGVLALVSLGIAGGAIGWFLLPALLTGEPALAVTVVTASAIMFVILYLTHGISIRTSTALAGTLIGIVISALAAQWSIEATHLNGVIDDGGSTLSTLVPGMNLHNVLKAAAVIAGLGALNDVTITQASSVWELREAAPGMSRWALYRSAMRIGRDHVASAIYTLAFAYVGSALTLLLALGLYDRSLFGLLGAEEIAEEIVHAMVGGLGVLLAMPATTVLGVLLMDRGRQRPAELSEGDRQSGRPDTGSASTLDRA
jgi:uncharacterized membrane protein